MTRSDVTLTGVAEIDVTSGGGGEILIFANNINVLGGSDICAGIGADAACGGRATDFGSPNAQAGDIFFNALDTVTIDGGISDVNNNVNFNSLGNGGNINIQTGSLSVTNGGRINTITAGEGNAGTIKINATEQVFLADSADNTFTSLRSNIASDGIGNSGGININTDSLSVQDGAQIQSFILGAGNSGKITINANSIEFSGRDINDFPSGAFSNIQADNTGNVGMGNAGGIDITANSLVMSDRAQFLSNTGGVGNAGDINLQIAENTYLFNSSILSEVSAPTEDSAGGFGEGGDINITTNSFLLQDGSSLLVDTENVGNAGNIKIATNNFSMGGRGVSAGRGATNLVPSQITTTVEEQAIGNGGNITISASSMVVSNDAFISATTFGQGNAGIIDISAEEIELADGGEIIAETAFGEGGNIFLNVDNSLTLQNNSLISARAFNQASGGNININTDFIIAFPNQVDGNGSDIIASAAEGDGGNININADSLFGIQEGRAINNNRINDIDASSEFGLDGNVSIFTPDINPVQGVTELPTNIVEPAETVTQACQPNDGTVAENELSLVGKGGIPPEPIAPLDSHNIFIGGQTNPTSTIPKPIETSQGKIQPARGIKVTETGEIILTAYRTNNSGERIPEGAINCDRT